MPFRQDLPDSNNRCETSEFFLFCPPCPVECAAYSTGVSRKGKITSSAISVSLVPLPAGRAVRYRSNSITKLDINFKILSYEDIK
jgi:hypothetical protein